MGTTVEKADYAFETKDLLKTEINKINNVLDDNSTFRSYPQELFNGYLDILNNGTDTLWNNLEKVSSSGEEATLENVETAPIKMVLNGNTSQDGTPTPDTPVEVKVVTGENVVSVQGKNLLKLEFTNDASTIAGLNFTHTDSAFTLNGTTTSTYKIFNLTNSLPIINGETYTFSANVSGTNPSMQIAIYLWNNTNNVISNIKLSTSNNYKATKTLNFSGTGELVLDHCTFVIENLTNNSNYDLSCEVQLEQNSQTTPYVPYSKTDYPINLGDIELCKINTYKDYFHKDSGKWYVHKEIEKVILDGTENWPRTNAKDNHWRFRTFKYGNIASVQECYSNNFKFNGDTWNYEGINTGKSVIWIRNDELFTTESDLKTWLSTHNVTLYYVLATPTEEEITNSTLIEQLEAISKAKSVKDKTYITQTNDELPFILDVEAIKEYEVN